MTVLRRAVALLVLVALVYACADDPTQPVRRRTLTITPAELLLAPDRSAQLMPTLGSRTLEPTAVEWTVLDTLVAAVSSDGTVTARKVGDTEVRGTVEEASASIALSVKPATLQLSADSLLIEDLARRDTIGTIVTGPDGKVLEDPQVLWSTSNPSVATVEDGIISPVGPGLTWITAQAHGGSDRLRVIVEASAVAPASLELTPATDTVHAIGLELELVPTARDTAGDIITGPALTWTVGDTTVLRLVAPGRVLAAGLGRSSVTVRADSLEASADVVVDPVAVAVAIAQRDIEMRSLGATEELAATSVDANAHPVANASHQWTSRDEGVVTVSEGGLLTAVGEGDTHVVVTEMRSSVSDSVTVRVVIAPGPPVVSTLTVEPAVIHFSIVGDTEQTSVVVQDQFGDTLSDVDLRYSVGDEDVASVSASGLVTAVGAGTTNLIVEAVGADVADTATITVDLPEPAIASVVASPSEHTFTYVGDVRQITARAYDDGGSELPDAGLTYTSTGPVVVSVSPSGLMRAEGAGSAMVVVSAGDVADSVRVTVNLPPPPPADAFFSDDFEGYAPGQRLAVTHPSGFRWHGAHDGTYVTNEIARTGSRSLKFEYGPHEPGDPSHTHWWAEQRFNLGRDLQQIWMEWYIYVLDGSEGLGARYHHNYSSAANNIKLLALWADDYQDMPRTILQLWSTNAPDFGSTISYSRTIGNFDGPSFYAGGRPPMLTGDEGRGRWIQLRLYNRIADMGVNNGVFQLWRDGDLILDVQQDSTWDGRLPIGNYFRNGYLWGYDNNRFPEFTAAYVDDISFYDAPPAWFDGGSSEPAVPTTLSVAPSTHTFIGAGGTQQATATIRSQTGQVMTGLPVSWRSTNSAVVSVTGDGLMRAEAIGEAQVIASFEELEATLAVTVSTASSLPAWAEGSWDLTASNGALGLLDFTDGTLWFESLTTMPINLSVSGSTVIANFTVPDIGSGTLTLSGTHAAVSGSISIPGLGTASVTGTPRSDSEPSPDIDLRAHEPAGFTLVTTRPFNALNEDGWNDSVAGAGENPATLTLIQDLTAPASPDNIARVTYPTGFTGAGSSSQNVRLIRSLPDAQALYLSFVFKISENWYGHTGAGVNKIFYLGHPVIVDAHGSATGGLHLRIALQGGEAFNAEWDGGTGGAPNEVSVAFEDAELVRGQWHHAEVLLELNTPGEYNGRIHAWLDGTKILQYSNRRILSGTPGQYSQIDFIQWHPIYGGQGGVNVPSEQYQFMDHLYLSALP